MDNLQITFLALACFYISNTFAENVANISDSLAVETTVDTISLITNLVPETKSKTEKRDSSDQIGTTIYTLKEDESFRPITSETYHQQLQSQQFESSASPSTFQPTAVPYVAEEAAPQIYYDKPPNVVRDVSHVLPSSSSGKVSDYVSGGIQYPTPSNVYRGPYREPYELRLEQIHPQPSQQQQQKQHHQQKLQQQQFQLNQRHQQLQYAQPAKAPPNLGYVSPPTDSGFMPLEGPVQQQPPYYIRQQQTQQNTHSPQPDEQQKQQQYPPYQKQLQQQPQYIALQKQSIPQQQQQQQQQHQHQQPGRQQINYIIAIPLSYVRQLQHQLASPHGSAPASASASPTPQNQQQSSSPLQLQAPRSHLPPLLVLRPINGEGSSSSGSSLNRESYRLQSSPIHYAPQAPTPSKPEVNSHPQSAPAVAPQQLPFPMNLVLTAAPVRPRQTIYPAPHLLYVQPQLIRQIPQQQQVQLQVKQHQHLPRYVQRAEEQQPRVEERNAQQNQQQQPQSPQQHEHPRVTVFVPKPTVKQVLVPSPSAAISSSPASHSHIPTKATSSHTPQPVFYYNPAYVQPPPFEQHPLPPSPYANYIQAQIGAGQHAPSLVKLTAYSPHYYPVHNSVGGPQNLLVSKVPLQIQQPPHQQSPALPAFVSRPAVYMATPDILNGVGLSETGAGLPYFMHPSGVHYGTHLYNPGIPLGVSPKFLDNVLSADADSQQQPQIQQLRPEQHRTHQQQPQQQQQQQRLGSTAASGGNDNNNAIVKYP